MKIASEINASHIHDTLQTFSWCVVSCRRVNRRNKRLFAVMRFVDSDNINDPTIWRISDSNAFNDSRFAREFVLYHSLVWV